jgi:TBC1 domain family member 20
MELQSDLATHILNAGVQPYFCIAWILTWFAHNVDDFTAIARIYDSCISSHPLFPIYITAAVLMTRRHEILAEPCEHSALYKCLVTLPSNLDWEAILRKAHQYAETIAPTSLYRMPSIPLATRTMVEGSASIRRYPIFVAAVSRGQVPLFILIPRPQPQEH